MRQATVKQKAFIAYLGHQDPENASAADASEFIDKAMNAPEFKPLIARWNTDKLRLHPDIYHKEVATMKAERFRNIFEFCESERETYHHIDPTYWPLNKLNLKVCKQAVEWLDAGYAGWDTELFDSKEFLSINEKVIETYFVPAIANVAPVFIKKERSGNPNPPARQRHNTAFASQEYIGRKQKRKRGCLWWICVLVLFFAYYYYYISFL